jgi:imidazolonepropionase-like amidohydrolase
VTTVRDLGANGSMVVELAQQIERGTLEGPRIIAAARGITITGGHGMEIGRSPTERTQYAARHASRSRSARPSSSCSPPAACSAKAPGPELAAYTPEETQAAVDEAHRAGIRITTHAHGAEGMRIAADAGVDSIEHATLLDKQTIQLIKAKDVALVPTFSALRRILDNSRRASGARHGAGAGRRDEAPGGCPRRAQGRRADRRRYRRRHALQHARPFRARARLSHRGRTFT